MPKRHCRWSCRWSCRCTAIGDAPRRVNTALCCCKAQPNHSNVLYVRAIGIIYSCIVPRYSTAVTALPRTYQTRTAVTHNSRYSCTKPCAILISAIVHCSETHRSYVSYILPCEGACLSSQLLSVFSAARCHSAFITQPPNLP